MIVFATTCLILCLSIAGICVGIILVGEIREASHQRYLDELEAAQEDADYAYSLNVELEDLDEWQRLWDAQDARREASRGYDFSADEKGYS